MAASVIPLSMLASADVLDRACAVAAGPRSPIRSRRPLRRPPAGPAVTKNWNGSDKLPQPPAAPKANPDASAPRPPQPPVSAVKDGSKIAGSIPREVFDGGGHRGPGATLAL